MRWGRKTWLPVAILWAGLFPFPGLGAASDIVGRVIDDHGEGVSQVRLQLVRADGSPQAVIKTNPVGRFETQLPPGEYFIYEADSSALLGRVTVKGDPVHIELHWSRSAPSTHERLEGESQVDAETQQLQSIAGYRVLTADDNPHSLRAAAEVFNPFLTRRPKRFHGTVYEFHRNDYFDARNFFDPVGEPLPEFKRNQFGGQFAGALWEKLSFVGSFDALRIVQGSTIVSHVPTASQKKGDFSALPTTLTDPLTGRPFANNIIPLERINPVAQALLNIIPNPNQQDVERNFINSQPRVSNENRYTLRADYQWADQTKLVGNFTLVDRQEVRVKPLSDFNSDRLVDHQNLRLALDHRFSDRFLGSFSINLSRHVDLLLSRNSGNSGLLDSIGIQGLTILDDTDEGYPTFSLSGYAPFGDERSPDTSTRNNLSFNSNFNYSKNDHSLSFGTRGSAHQINDDRTGGNRRGSFQFSGAFTGDSFADFLLGSPQSAQRGIGSNRVDLRARFVEFFARDQWKINQNLALTLAITYQKRPPWKSQSPVSGFFPLTLEPSLEGGFVISGTEEARALGFNDHTLTRPDENNFAPRIAIAYSPRGNNSLVIRSGFSLFYIPIDQSRYVEDMARNFPFFSQQEASSSVLEPQIDLENPFARIEDTAITVSGIEPNPQTTYIQSWNLDIKKRLGRNLNFEVRYRGTRSVGSLRKLPGNIPLPGPGDIQARRPNPNLGEFQIVSTDGNRSHNALHVNVERQLANSFSIKSGFKWAKTLNDSVWRSAVDSRNFSLERAVDENPQKTFFVNYIFELPFGDPTQGDESGWFNRFISGWKLSGTTRLNDGRRYTVRLAVDGNNDGLGGDRPDRIGSGELSVAQRSINAWFDTSAFAEPDGFSPGTSGRNILRSPSHHSWDTSLSKNTSLANGHFLEFRVQFFNALNQVNFRRPNASFGTSSFGQIFGAGEAREVEVALKYSF